MLNVIDILCLVLLVTGTLIGLHRKLSGELARLIGAVIIFVLAVSFYRPAGLWLTEHTRLAARPDIALALAYVLLAIAAFIFMLLIRLVLRRIMQVTFNKKIDRIGGALAGFCKAALIITILVTTLGIWPNPWLKRLVVDESFVGNFMFTRVFPAAPDKHFLREP